MTTPQSYCTILLKHMRNAYILVDGSFHDSDKLIAGRVALNLVRLAGTDDVTLISDIYKQPPIIVVYASIKAVLFHLDAIRLDMYNSIDVIHNYDRLLRQLSVIRTYISYLNNREFTASKVLEDPVKLVDDMLRLVMVEIR